MEFSIVFLLAVIAFTLLFGKEAVFSICGKIAWLGVIIFGLGIGVALLLSPFLIWPPETIFGIAILLWCPLLITYRLIVGWEPQRESSQDL
jgi:hypothetical protein